MSVRLLLTHGYFLEEDPKEKLIMKPYPTLGLLYISGYLKERAIEHDVFDTTFSTTAAFKEHVFKTKPNLIAFYTNLMTKVKVIQLMQFIKSSPELKETYIVLGGPDLTYNIENYLDAGADFLVIGEGEQTVFELVEALENQTDLKAVEGLVFRENGQTQKNPPRTKMKELGDLPLPNREAFPIEKYLETWKTHHGESALNVSTQRGCPYTCKWCSTAVYGQSYRRRPAKAVVEELTLLMERYQPDTFWFVDDVFTVSHKWLEEFHTEVKKADLKIKYEIITRAERMNEQVIEWLKESGCFRVWIGAESGSQKVIDLMDRRVDVSQVKDMLIKTRQAGIETGTFIMVGYPGETIDDIRITAQYLEDSLPDHFTITKSYPIKGTTLYDEIEAEITQQPEWNTSTDREIDFKRAYSDRFYHWAIRYVLNRLEFARMNAKSSAPLLPKLKVGLKAKLSEMMMQWETRA